MELSHILQTQAPTTKDGVGVLRLNASPSPYYLVSTLTPIQIKGDLLCVALPGVMLKMVESDKTQSIVWHHISLEDIDYETGDQSLPPTPHPAQSCSCRSSSKVP